MHVLPAVGRKGECRTGTRLLVRSRAVGDDQPIVRYIGEMFFDRIGGNTDRLGEFSVCFGPRFRITRVNEKHILATLDQPFQSIDSNSLNGHKNPHAH